MTTYYAAGAAKGASVAMPTVDGNAEGENVLSGTVGSLCSKLIADSRQGGERQGSNMSGRYEISGDSRSFYAHFKRRRNRDLRDQIRAETDLSGILDLVAERGALWDAIGVSTALHTVAWRCRLGGKQPDFANDRRWHQLRELVRSKLSSVEARNLANNAWALASMACHDTPLLGEIASGVLRVAVDLKTQEVSNTSWAFATVKWPDASLFCCLATQMLVKAADGVNQDLTNTLWSFATVAFTHEPLFALLCAYATERVHEFKPQELANAVWALATSACKEEALILRVSRKALETLPEFLTQNLANFIWAYAKLGYDEDIVIRCVQAEVHHKLEFFSAQDLSTAVWAFSTMAHRDDRFLKRCVLAWQSRAYVKAVHPQHISNTLWSFATVPLHDVPCFADLALGAVRQLSAFKAQELSNTIWACATVAHRDQALTDAIAQEATLRLQDFDTQGIGNTTWAVALLETTVRKMYFKVWERLGESSCLMHCSEKVFSMLVWGFFRCGEIELAWRLLDRLVLNRVNPGIAAFGVWLHQCRHRRPDIGREVRVLLYLAKLRPCRHLIIMILNAVVMRLRDCGEMASAFRLLRHMATDSAGDHITELLHDRLAGAVDLDDTAALHKVSNMLAIDWHVPVRIRGNLRCDYDKECQVLRYVMMTAQQGNPGSVIESIERFSEEGNGWLKIAGDEKGAVLDDLVQVLTRAPPRLILEFGCYVGYSACRMARLLQGAGHLISVEVDPVHACIAQSMLEFAGLYDKVTIYVGYSEEAIPNLHSICNGTTADVIFMDQRGTRFHIDLQALEAQKLLSLGCLVTADNVLKPGAPHFLWHLHSSEEYQLTVVSLREFAAERIEDWMCVARYTPLGDTQSGVEPPDELAELAFRTDRVRQRSCAGDNPGEVGEDDWACHSQEVRRAYTAAGICPRIVHVHRREDGTPYVDW